MCVAGLAGGFRLMRGKNVCQLTVARREGQRHPAGAVLIDLGPALCVCRGQGDRRTGLRTRGSLLREDEALGVTRRDAVIAKRQNGQGRGLVGCILYKLVQRQHRSGFAERVQLFEKARRAELRLLRRQRTGRAVVPAELVQNRSKLRARLLRKLHVLLLHKCAVAALCAEVGVRRLRLFPQCVQKLCCGLLRGKGHGEAVLPRSAQAAGRELGAFQTVCAQCAFLRERGERVGRVYIGAASAGIFNQDCLRLLLPLQAARRGGKLRLRVKALLMQPVQQIGLFGKRLRIKRLPCRAGEGIAGKAAQIERRRLLHRDGQA